VSSRAICRRALHVHDATPSHEVLVSAWNINAALLVLPTPPSNLSGRLPAPVDPDLYPDWQSTVSCPTSDDAANPIATVRRVASSALTPLIGGGAASNKRSVTVVTYTPDVRSAFSRPPVSAGVGRWGYTRKTPPRLSRPRCTGTDGISR
jgi:hypothetical protein